MPPLEENIFLRPIFLPICLRDDPPVRQARPGDLYCPEAQTGAVAWTFHGAPACRPNRRQLGKVRLTVNAAFR